MTRRRLPLLLTAVLLSGCSAGNGGDEPFTAPSPEFKKPEGLTLPAEDRVVRVDPGSCGANDDCVLRDPSAKSVTVIDGPERPELELREALATALASSGWRVRVPGDSSGGLVDLDRPLQFQRGQGPPKPTLVLSLVSPSRYALAFYELDASSPQ